MPKKSGKPEIYFLLLLFTPSELIAKGFSRGTVYKYNSEMASIKERIKKAFNN